MASLTAYTNNLLKAKGLSAKEAKAKAKKAGYKSIKEAKAAGSVYYTKKVKGKDGKLKDVLMVAAYAEDLNSPIKETPLKKKKDQIFIPKGDKKRMPTTPEAKKKVVEGSKLKDNQKKMLLEQLEANEKRKAANAAKKKNLNKGGMMKKKGYAKGGMKKKGYAMGGMMPMDQKKKINPTTGLSMNRGGMTDMRKSGMFKGGMTKKK